LTAKVLVFDGKSAMNIKDKPANLVSTNTLLK